MRLSLVMLTAAVMILAGCSGGNGGTAGASQDEQSAAGHERSFEPYEAEQKANAQPETPAAQKNESAPKEEESAYTGPAAPYIKKLGDSNSTVRDRAADKLIDMGADVVEALIAALKDRDADIRANAAWILGQIKDERAVEPLIEAARDRNAKVRSYAALALGKLGDKRAIPVLNSAVNDTDRDVRLTAEQALAKLEPKKTPLPSKTVLTGLGPEAAVRTFINSWATKNPVALFDCISSGMKRQVAAELAQIKSSSG